MNTMLLNIYTFSATPHWTSVFYDLAFIGGIALPFRVLL